MVRAFLLIVLLAACDPRIEAGVTVLATPDTDPLVADSLEFIGDPQLRHAIAADPAAEAARRGGFVISVTPRTDCTQCYRLEGDGDHVRVIGGVPLGIQYGVAHALELFGYRFFHPWRSKVPVTLSRADASALGKEYAPEVDLRRGLHLHTLHPIESLYDFWIPGEENLKGALRTIDFVVKNRGNYIQWCALDDIMTPAKLDAWRVHNKAIVDYAHRRGVKVGIAIQLFGKSNLQNAFDLVDEDADPAAEMKRRLHLILDGQGFDNINLSFGEFFAADPAVFVAQVNAAYEAMQEASPGVEVSAPIHVGNYPNLRVSYMGTTQLYYFLVRYANPAITPWIHSVMYFNLYEDAGLAYLHEDFSEHRAFLEDKVRAEKPVGYFPESAYWIAFDNSIPTYLPLYMRSRFTDLQRLKAAGRLRDHTLFSSGWEWGFWQTDAATLRMGFTLPSTWDQPVKDNFAAYGDQGTRLATLISRLGEVQHQGLLIKRLAGYVSGRDQIIDAGKALGIISQPDRIQFDEFAKLMPAARAAFVTQTLEPLQKLADDVSAIDAELKALALPNGDPFLAEMNDAFDITARRFRFVHALYRASQSYADGKGDEGWLAKAEIELDAAKLTVTARRKGLHDPDPKPILRDTPNPTFYKYGYLREADSLCFWVRERAQARQLILQTGDFVPGCIL
jgi:hypothetical protein